MLASTIKEGEERVAARRNEAAAKKAELARSFHELQLAQTGLLGDKLDGAISEQREVEEAALRLTKNVNSLYQRAAKWKAEQKRFRANLDGLDRFVDWAAAAEADLHAIAGNLEYVCAVLEKEHGGAAAPTASSGSAAAGGGGLSQ